VSPESTRGAMMSENGHFDVIEATHARSRKWPFSHEHSHIDHAQRQNRSCFFLFSFFITAFDPVIIITLLS
jgi:hypothetical protein